MKVSKIQKFTYMISLLIRNKSTGPPLKIIPKPNHNGSTVDVLFS